jgi:hypothetical protein
MDIIQHGTLSGLATYSITGDITCSAVSAFISMLPDIIGFAEKVYHKNYSLWNWYRVFHNRIVAFDISGIFIAIAFLSWTSGLLFLTNRFSIITIYSIIISASWYLHILIDYFWHKPEGGWKDHTIYLTHTIWVILILWIGTLLFF